MKILLASDSHHNTDLVNKLSELYPNMDLYLFAGDSEDCSSNLYPFDSIRGNCDFYEFDEKRFIRTEYFNILIKHHPQVTADELMDVKLFIHGHTHQYKIECNNKIITLCPGSLSYSRDDSNGSYAIIDVNNNCIDIKILSVETKKILLNKKYNIN